MEFNAQPIISGSLVTLRPLTLQDFDDLYAVAADPLIWEQHPSSNRYQESVFRTFFDEAIASKGAFAVIDNASKKIIGSSRFYGFNRERGEVEIGWTFLARSYWGGRYNGEMKRLMLNHAFQIVERVIFLIGPDNIRSQRAVERIGGKRIGFRKDDTGLESVAYGIAKREFVDIDV